MTMNEQGNESNRLLIIIFANTNISKDDDNYRINFVIVKITNTIVK